MNEADLHAYIDGRLDAERRAAVESWLAAHPEEQERVAAYRQLGEALRDAYDTVLSEAVPAHLHSRTRAPWKRFVVAAGWIAIGIAIGAVAGWWLHDSRPAPAPAADAGAVMARRAAIAHATYSPEVRHPVEVGADDEPHLTAWLSKRLGTPVRAPKLEAVGYKLIGGRLLPGESGPVAHFMYQCSRGTRVTLYVRSDMPSQRSTAFRYAREGSVDVYYWVDAKLGYAVSSADIGKENLLGVANAAYQQLNPP